MTKRKTVVKKTAAMALSLEETVKQEVAKQIPKVDTGIVVALPNTTEEKMRAISNLAMAVKELASALTSTNVNVRIEKCNFQNHALGISVMTKPQSDER